MVKEFESLVDVAVTSLISLRHKRLVLPLVQTTLGCAMSYFYVTRSDFMNQTDAKSITVSRKGNSQVQISCSKISSKLTLKPLAVKAS